jgi:uncharacterized protein YdeI (YjbR/CyaY-like superfamily)
MRKLYVSTRAQWRRWLSRNHDKELHGVWLVYFKKGKGRASLEYEESVEEALCFGWIDSLIKRIDDARYCRKFTPRQDGSQWSDSNRKRVEKVISEARMTEFGRAKVETAKRLGTWSLDSRPAFGTSIPIELTRALRRNAKAREHFETLAPTYRKHFIGWIAAARKQDTRARRLEESLALLSQGKKLGMK